MRIIVHRPREKSIFLILPSAFALNGVSAAFFSAALRKKQVEISAQQLSALFSAIKSYKKTHPKWKLMEVQERNGNVIEIVL